MYTDVTWDRCPAQGNDDGKIRVYLCVQGTSPRSVADQRWEIKQCQTLREAVAIGETLRKQPEFYGAAFAVIKRASGELVIGYWNASPLVAWADLDQVVAWGAEVLCGALMRLETESGWGHGKGATWSASRGETEGYYPNIVDTTAESPRWPDHLHREVYRG